MFRKSAVAFGILMTLFVLMLGSASASQNGQGSQDLVVVRSEDLMSATATWTPDLGAEFQAFFVVARLHDSEGATGNAVVPESFRYIDYPLGGDVSSLVIDELDAGKDYIYGVTSIARDSNGEWEQWSPWRLFREHLAFTTAATDREALVALYNMADGANWRANTNWLSSAPIGQWQGVETDSDGRVVEVSLWLNKLEGQIPSDLGNLAKLERLNLILNRLSGEIPSELGMLANLEELTLLGNRLTGEIPSELGNLTNLEKLYLSVGNQFTGCIPSALQNVAENDLSELGLPFCS